MCCSKAGIGFVVTLVLGAAAYFGKGVEPPKAVSAPATAEAAVVDMVTAANELLAGFSPANRDKASFGFDDPQRTNWHYYPRTPWPRKGAVLKEMTPKEKDLVKSLVKAGTSPAGYDTAMGIWALENILRDIENTPLSRVLRDSDRYYVNIFGKPALTGKWGWRLEGHHYILNYVIEDGRVVSATPQVVGANPGEVPSGPSQGLRVLAKEEDVARQLLTSLSAEHRRRAIIADTAPFDVLTEVKVQPKPLPLEGLSYAAMNAGQQKRLLEVIKLYSGRHPPAVAERLMRDVTDGDLAKVHFAWAGSPLPGEPHYYRIQGPYFVIEFCNAQNRANHSHAVWRSYRGDFGLPYEYKG